MSQALVLLHVAFEDLGSLGEALTDLGHAITRLEASTADLQAIDALAPELLVVLGGPIGVYERAAYPFLDAELGLIRRRLEARRPTLGLCLGAQLMAAALGAAVYPGANGKEIGWAPVDAGEHAAAVPGFDALAGVPVLHWHGDTFDLPAGALPVASTPAYRQQAFAVGRHALGLQFHPEVRERDLERWYVGHACELAAAGIDVAQLRRDGHAHAPRLESAARTFWRQWLEAVAPGRAAAA